MSTFFHGWRRKLGCALLLLACMFTVLWVRSCLVIDNFAVQIGDRRLQVALFRGGAYVEILDVSAFRNHRGAPPYSWRVRPADPSIRSESWNLQGPVKCVPFRQFVVVLGSLAAYLILWKPRKVAVSPSTVETLNA